MPVHFSLHGRYLTCLFPTMTSRFLLFSGHATHRANRRFDLSNRRFDGSGLATTTMSAFPSIDDDHDDNSFFDEVSFHNHSRDDDDVDDNLVGDDGDDAGSFDDNELPALDPTPLDDDSSCGDDSSCDSLSSPYLFHAYDNNYSWKTVGGHCGLNAARADDPLLIGNFRVKFA